MAAAAMKVGERKKKKVIIDTDPGIVDRPSPWSRRRDGHPGGAAVAGAGGAGPHHHLRQRPHLLETVGRTDIPVAEGSHVALKEDTKLRIASACHGSDGMGNQGLPPETATKPVDQPAAAFLVEQANLYPGQVTVVALGPLTNLALALELDPSFPKKIGQVVVLGGAYSVSSCSPATLQPRRM
ncbi:hypothetical protein PVAP13_5NG161281 [Panicum virgatum]|uniref:Inosine/uridine-preferring nucleoside hydrolase domain-containing protein n=1 Tax=Panicum virgatum TaxID=38727 RepID=A0A8T0RS82_PANVG|nr:hypothetical protein PVAP13_5NG161281 [Panicum virgatum]